MKHKNHPTTLLVFAACCLFECGKAQKGLICGPGTVEQEGDCVETPQPSQGGATGDGSGGAGSGASGNSVSGAAGGGVDPGSSAGSGPGGAGGMGTADSVCVGATQVLTLEHSAIADFDSSGLAPFYNWDTEGAADFKIEEPGANDTTAAAHAMGTTEEPMARASVPYVCTDVGTFSGVVLWAKSDTASTLRVLFSTPELLPPDFGGDCQDGCWGFHSVTLDLTSEWRFLAVPFADVARPSWAAPIPWKDVIMSIDLAVDGDDFDLWVDEFAFYAGDPPDGAELPQ